MKTKGLKDLWRSLKPFDQVVQSLDCLCLKTTPSSVLNKGIKLRPSCKQVGVIKKSPNKSECILQLSAGNFGAIRLEEAPKQVVIAPELPNGRRLNAMPTKAKLKFNDRMKQVAVQWLQVYKWSSELISVRGKETELCPVSHECLYQWFWANKHGNKSANHPF